MVNAKREKQAKDMIKYFVGTKENLNHVREIADHYKSGKIVNIKGAEKLINSLTGRGEGPKKAKEQIASLSIIKSIEKRNLNDPLTTIVFHTDCRLNMKTSSFTELYSKIHKVVLKNIMDVFF